MAEIFQSKYTAEEIEQIFDHVNEKNKQIDTNTEGIENIKTSLTDVNQRVNQVSIAQKTVNTELDYCWCSLKTNYTPVIGEYVPFEKVSGTFEINNGRVIIKPGQCVQINITISYDINANIANIKYNLKDYTNDKLIAIVQPINNHAAHEYSSAFFCQYTNDTDKDCEIGLYVNNIYTIDTMMTFSMMTIQEIGRTTVIDPVEHINTIQGLEDTPVGYIISHASITTPKHYLLCDGSEYSISDYPYLAQYIQDNFGSISYFGGDGISTFAVPKLNNENAYNEYYTVEFEETTGYADSIHIANMNITESNDNAQYFFQKQSDYKYIVLQDFSAEVIGTVINYNTASGGTKGQGEFRQYRNNVLVKSITYEAQTNYVDSTGTNQDTFDFKAGDIFYFYTPSKNGYPKQYGTIKISTVSVNYVSYIKYEPTYYMNVFGLREEVVLWEGNHTSTDNLILIDSIENYDEIIVYASLSNAIFESSITILKQRYKYGVTNAYVINGGVTDYLTRRALFGFNDTKTISIAELSDTVLVAVYGIKYKHTAEGTITSGKSYTEEELQEAIVDIVDEINKEPEPEEVITENTPATIPELYPEMEDVPTVIPELYDDLDTPTVIPELGEEEPETIPEENEGGAE